MARTSLRTTTNATAAVLGAMALGCPGGGTGEGSSDTSDSAGTMSAGTMSTASTADDPSTVSGMSASGSGTASTTASNTDTLDDTATDTGPPAACGEQFFPDDSPWYRDYTDADVHPNSDAIVTWLEGAGWGGGDEMRIDFSIEILEATADTPRMPFEATGDFYSPDCDFVPVPVPDGGALEGEAAYACTNDGDCHLIVYDCDEGLLYEMWRANIDAGTFYGGCLAVWDMNMVYPETGRGDGCTSADAAGFPIAPLLFSADEVAAGEINHAIRFILPNENIRHYIYTRPATHSTGPTSAPEPAPPYGVHLRLRSDYPLDSLPSDGARVVAQAMQRHGMFLADGGQITLTARSDRFTTAKWDGLLDSYDLSTIRPSDFQVIDWGPDLDWEQVECTREPLGGVPP